MYILFHKDPQQQTGEFIEHSQRYSKVTECYVPKYTVVGEVRFSEKEVKGRRKRIVVFHDLRKDFKKEFSTRHIAAAVQFGKRYFQTYNNK